MRPLYHEIDSQLEFFTKKNTTLPPHLHKYLECIYVTEGNFHLKIASEWKEMHPHDLAVIFPDVIHQFQVEEAMESHAVYVLGTPALSGPFAGILQKYSPRTPVIRGENLHPDISYAFHTLMESEQTPYDFELRQAYFQVLLARTLPVCDLVEKEELEFSDLAWRAASYISEHFMEELSLSDMARKLCVSPYVLSRTFSGILHTGFNQYLNEIRLDYASHLLRTTDKSITSIFINSGFSSQTTFNRAFKEKYRMSPRDYRNQNQQAKERHHQSIEQPEATERGQYSDLAGLLVKGRFL